MQLPDARQPQRVGQPPVERMAVRHGLAAHRGQQGEASIGRARNEVHQDVERALVGPLEIVNQHDHRCGAGHVLQPGIQQRRCLV